MSPQSQSGNMPAYRKYYALYFLAIIVAIATCALIYGIFRYLYSQTSEIMVEETKSSLLTLVESQSLRFSYADIEAVSTSSDAGSPSHTRLVSALHDIKLIAPKIAYAYILTYNPAEKTYAEIADADSLDPSVNTDERTDNDIDVNNDGIIDPNGADELVYPGTVYVDAPIDDLAHAHDVAHVNDTFYSDRWGTFISAYAPIKNPDGTLSGLLALDMRDDDIRLLEDEVFVPFKATVFILTFSLLSLGFVIIYLWQKKLKQVLIFDRQKNIVIGMIGHELKNPLAAIRWILSSAMEMKDLPPLARKKVEQAYNVSVSAAEMSNTILDLSRMQLGKLDLVKEECDMAKLVESVGLEMIPIAESKGINLDMTLAKSGIVDDSTVYASPQYIKIAIKNLISNAVKYTPEGGKVSVSLIAPAQDRLRLIVSDTGVGIKDEDQKHMFQKFSRAKSTSNIEGHGLGLYLTHNIVLLHGGSLHFVSTEGKGTEFTMEIPRYQV